MPDRQNRKRSRFRCNQTASFPYTLTEGYVVLSYVFKYAGKYRKKTITAMLLLTMGVLLSMIPYGSFVRRTQTFEGNGKNGLRGDA